MAEIRVFQESYERLHLAIQPETSSLAHKLYSKALIGTEAHDAASISSKPLSDRASTVLKDVETNVLTTPSLINDFLDVLGSVTSLERVATEIKTKLCQATSANVKQRKHCTTSSELVFNCSHLPSLPANSAPVYSNCKIFNLVMSPESDVDNICKALDQTSISFAESVVVRDSGISQSQILSPELAQKDLPHFKQTDQEACTSCGFNSTDDNIPTPEDNYFTPNGTSYSRRSPPLKSSVLEKLNPTKSPESNCNCKRQESTVSTKSSEGYSTDEDLIELGRVVDNCKKKIKKLKQKVKEQKKEMRSIVCNNVKLEEKLKRMEQALDDVTEQKKQLQEELVSKEMLNDQLQEGIRLAQEKSIKQDKQLHCLGQRTAEHHAEKIRLQKKCTELEKEVKRAQDPSTEVDYREELMESERKRKDLEKHVERLQEHVEHHEVTISNLELEIEILLQSPNIGEKTESPPRQLLPDSTS